MKMSEEIEIKELVDLGLLHEINRKVLHPCGLAMYIIEDEETGEISFGGIFDSRDDPEGFLFNQLDKDKILKALQAKKPFMATRTLMPECDNDGIQVRSFEE